MVMTVILYSLRSTHGAARPSPASQSIMAKTIPRLTPEDIQRVIAVAWDDRPPFPAVLRSHGLSHGQVVQLLKRELTPNAFKVWQARIRGPAAPLRAATRAPARSPTQNPKR